MTTAHFLMCRPDHFAVDYVINPWMNPDTWAQQSRVLVDASHREWTALHRALAGLGATIELVPPAPRLPDLVFTANAAVVLDGKAVLARFRHPERRGEEEPFERGFRALQARGIVRSVAALPGNLVLEGAGDCVWDHTRNLYWMGYGPRSDRAAAPVIKDMLGVETVSLELVDPRFYHLDTALCPLTKSEVMFVPAAFTPQGLACIHERVAPALRIEVPMEDACHLAANAVCVGDTIVLSRCGDRLHRMLSERGYHVITTPLPSFLRSGGSAFCLTLRLDLRSHDGAGEGRAAVA
ncbi:MAG: amidinotransferase [Bradyrhizobiaceae bacterium]|nr:amidinotransferase [Bradyrhizobiaceae bacterium]